METVDGAETVPGFLLLLQIRLVPGPPEKQTIIHLIVVTNKLFDPSELQSFQSRPTGALKKNNIPYMILRLHQARVDDILKAEDDALRKENVVLT